MLLEHGGDIQVADVIASFTLTQYETDGLGRLRSVLLEIGELVISAS